MNEFPNQKIGKSLKEAYEFGGSEAIVRKYQTKYAKYFPPGSKVLDIGCGRGIFLDILQNSGAHPIGIDILPEAVKLCREKGFNAYCSDAFSYLNNKKEIFDGIFCAHVIEHIEPSKVPELFHLCYNALKPRGKLVIITPNPNDLKVMTEVFWLDLTHVRPYPLALLESLGHQAGFRVISKGEDKDTARFGGWKQRVIWSLRNITTIGLAGRKGNLYIVYEKK